MTYDKPTREFSETEDLIALVSSRICHDLANPLGAISNGMELLAMTNDEISPEFELISESVSVAIARLNLFRAAFGKATRDQSIGPEFIQEIFESLSGLGRTKYNLSTSTPLSRPTAKAVLLAVLCLETAMAFGGEVTAHEAAGTWRVDGKSDRLRIDDSLWEPLIAGRAPDETAANAVQFALLPAAAKDGSMSLQVELSDTHITIRL